MRVATCPTGTMIFRFPHRCRVTVVSVRRSSGIVRPAGELGTRSRPVSRHYRRSLPPPFRAITAWPNAYCRVVLPWCDDSTEVGDGSVPCQPGETGPTLSPYSARRPHDLRACPVHERHSKKLVISSSRPLPTFAGSVHGPLCHRTNERSRCRFPLRPLVPTGTSSSLKGPIGPFNRHRFGPSPLPNPQL